MSLYKHHAPSTTSLSDTGDDGDDDQLANVHPTHAQWADKALVRRPLQHSPISTVPAEVLITILKQLHSPKDLFHCLQVSRAWCECSVELLWHKPSFPKYGTVHKMAALLRRTDLTFTYGRFIRRLNFLNQGADLKDDLFAAFSKCDRLERLTLINCKHITTHLLTQMLPNFSSLVSIDLTNVIHTNTEAILALAAVSSRLQGINLAQCHQVTDAGVIALAKSCPLLRRVKLSGLSSLTDASVVALAEGCPMLLELDLNQCSLVTDASIRLIWTNLHHMRELRLSHCVKLTDLAFPSPNMLDNMAIDGPSPFPTFNNSRDDELQPLILYRTFEHLRMLDLTACGYVTDEAVEGIISHAPKIRNLVLSKCMQLTDRAVDSICKLGRHLHYLHLGHASRITDRSVRTLARSCTRIRYIDFANCVHLTDMSVFELSGLPRLRRIGLVRVNQLTDEAIYALAERHATLERIHLSYCDQISVMAIHFLLLKLHKLTHLSLTGVPAFRQPELQRFCREAPKDFNSAQRSAFCVYSGKGVSQLRAYLTELFDRITELNNTDDTEYEDEYDVEADPEDDTPEETVLPEERTPVISPVGHEFAFQRDRPVRVHPAPTGHSHQTTNQVSASANLHGASARLATEIQEASHSRSPRPLVHFGNTVADSFPVVESPVSPGSPELTGAAGPSYNASAVFRGNDVPMDTRPDMTYVGIGHGRGAIVRPPGGGNGGGAAQSVRFATPGDSGRGHVRSESDDEIVGILSYRRSPTSPGVVETRGRASEKEETTEDGRKSVRRSIRNTFENYAPSFLFSGRPPHEGDGGAGASSSGMVAR